MYLANCASFSKRSICPTSAMIPAAYTTPMPGTLVKYLASGMA
ncbi:hypothetical protein [Bacillus thuringiensis]